jgi:flavin reductase (DIM6/NTAB) family NADH-FMN oxidoreductase RutF
VPVDAEGFKRVAASWATGVTIVTSRSGDRQQGMTVSAFSEVSLDPPLFLVCADKSSITNELIAESGVFSVSILARGQEDLSNRFASKREEHRRFEGLDCTDGATGCPRVPGALAWIDCSVTRAVDAGDHVIYLARAEDAAAVDGEPLLYFRQAYGGLS